MPLPATDFPPECAALYPEGFRYPVEYLPPKNRITDPALLQPFADWLRPYVVRYNDTIVVSGQAPVAIRRLQRDCRPDTLKSAIRHLEWGKAGDDPAMQANFKAEDILAEAADWSEAGVHPRAIALIRSLPVPFQQTGTALRSLVRSLTALERYEEALAECQRLARDTNITEFARQLYQIQQAELLLHLGQRAQAETLLDDGQAQFRRHWSYYGMRAALALADGQEEVARMFVLKGGQLDSFHCYKMLWNQHLAPLETFIRAEFLTAEDKPRLYERDTDMQRLCYGIHGALVAGDGKTAGTLAQALQFRHVHNWEGTDALALALTGLGAWQEITTMLPGLPGAGEDRIQAVMALARWLLNQGGSARDVRNRLEDEHPLPDSARGEFWALLAWHAGGREGPLPPEGEVVLVDVAPKRWTEAGRDHWLLIRHPTRGLVKQRFFQDRSVHRPEGWSIRKHFPVLEETPLTTEEAEAWLENLMVENIAEQGKFIPYRWTVNWNGWQLPRSFQPRPYLPQLAETLRRCVVDPHFYFHNGPANTFGLQCQFGEKLTCMLRAALSRADRS